MEHSTSFGILLIVPYFVIFKYITLIFIFIVKKSVSQSLNWSQLDFELHSLFSMPLTYLFPDHWLT